MALALGGRPTAICFVEYCCCAATAGGGLTSPFRAGSGRPVSPAACAVVEGALESTSLVRAAFFQIGTARGAAGLMAVVSAGNGVAREQDHHPVRWPGSVGALAGTGHRRWCAAAGSWRRGDRGVRPGGAEQAAEPTSPRCRAPRRATARPAGPTRTAAAIWRVRCRRANRSWGVRGVEPGTYGLKNARLAP